LKALQGMDVLVTGHTGFKGFWLGRLLHALGAKVHGISLPPDEGSLYAKNGGDFFETSTYADLRYFPIIEKQIQTVNPHITFHLAAQSLVLRSYVSPLETFEANVLGTCNVLESCLNNTDSIGVIVTTTDKVYLNLDRRAQFTEESPLGGSKDPYSLSKVAAEMAVAAWQVRAEEMSKCKVVAARAGNVIGGGDRAENRLLPDIIKSFLKDEVAEIRNPESVRPWQHVLDAVFGYVKVASCLVEGKPVSKSYNFGPSSESQLTVGEVANIVTQIWPGKQSWCHKPRAHAPHENAHLWLSSQKAMSELSWANKLNAEEAIAWTVEWELADMQNLGLNTMDSQISNYLGQP